MNTPRNIMIAALAVLATTTAVQSQQQKPLSKPELLERMSPDLLHNAVTPARRSGTFTPEDAVRVDDAGDADSFGRPVRWLGVAQADVLFAPMCRNPDVAGPRHCVNINPATLSANFELYDIARVRLPAGSSHSLLCQSLSPITQINYRNPHGTSAAGHMRYFAWLTVENAVLDDPKLIDPVTGQPYGGKVDVSMGALARHEEWLQPGQQMQRYRRDSIACVGGFLSSRALVEQYGLSDEQARAFFRSPTTLRLNVSGDLRNVEGGSSLVLGLRILGD